MCLYETINSSQTHAELNLEQPIPQELPYSEKLSRISQFCGYTRKFSLRNLGRGVLWRGKSEQSVKVFFAKIVFSPICESFLPRKFTAIR